MATFDADVSNLVKSAGRDIDKVVARAKKETKDRLWELMEQVCALTPPANAERQVLSVIDKAVAEESKRFGKLLDFALEVKYEKSGKLMTHALTLGGELQS
jgi:hypothetical protein